MRADLRRRTRETGSEIVEFSLVLLPLFAIIFLIVDASWAIFARSTLQFAVGEGVRYAITGQTINGTGTGQDASIVAVVQQNAMGLLSGCSGSCSISINYYLPTSATLVSGVGSNASGNVVQVSVTGFNVNPMAPLWRNTNATVLSATAGDVVEPSPGGVPPSR